jgi:hypothetical protein
MNYSHWHASALPLPFMMKFRASTHIHSVNLAFFRLKIMTFFFVLSLWFFYLTFDTFAYLNPKEVSWFEIDNTTAYRAQLLTYMKLEWLELLT